MDGTEILLLGIGIQPPWQLVEQRLDTDKTPHELHLEVKAERGSKFPCPECGTDCSAHDFKEKTWHFVYFYIKDICTSSRRRCIRNKIKA